MKSFWKVKSLEQAVLQRMEGVMDERVDERRQTGPERTSTSQQFSMEGSRFIQKMKSKQQKGMLITAEHQQQDCIKIRQ